MNLNKRGLTKNIANKASMSQEDTAKIINLFLEEIKDQFQKGHSIELRGFGTFYPHYKKPQTYIIPRLKEERVIQDYTTLKFKPSKQIRQFEK